MRLTQQGGPNRFDRSEYTIIKISLKVHEIVTIQRIIYRDCNERSGSAHHKTWIMSLIKLNMHQLTPYGR